MKKNIVPFDGLGFTIHLVNPPLITLADGSEVPKVNAKKIEKSVLKLLVKKKSPLTGSQLYFVRSMLDLSQLELSRILNLSSQSLISNYESRFDTLSGMDINTEILLIFKILEKLGLLKKNFDFNEKLIEVTPVRKFLKDDIIVLKAS